MENVKFTRNGSKLLIEVDLAARGGKSASGKSISIATTRGNVSCPGDEAVKVSVNVYTKADK